MNCITKMLTQELMANKRIRRSTALICFDFNIWNRIYKFKITRGFTIFIKDSGFAPEAYELGEMTNETNNIPNTTMNVFSTWHLYWKESCVRVIKWEERTVFYYTTSCDEQSGALEGHTNFVAPKANVFVRHQLFVT